MKRITIIGKNNIEKIQKKKKRKRLVTKKWNNKENSINVGNQIDYLSMLKTDNSFKEKRNIMTELNNKINSYKHQDIKKDRYNKEQLITLEETIDKLIDCSMNCYYCKKQCLLMYEKVRDNRQWTLDRINNNIGHFKDNVVICCLSCNLKKRLMDDEKFKFTKQLVINKME